MASSDSELIVKAKAGDKQAFTELYDRYSGKILSYLYRYTGNYQTAEDLTIETFLNAYNNLGRYEEMGVFSSWLFRIATNCAKMLFRRDRHEMVPIDAQPNEDDMLKLDEMVADESTRPDFVARKHEFKQFVEKILSKLDKKYREAFLLCDAEGLSYDEAGKIIGCNSKTVGTRVSRARRMFYDILRKYGYSFKEES